MKIFISQPMRNRSNEEIRMERNDFVKNNNLENEEILDTLFDFEGKSPIYYLAKSIEKLSEADLVFFMNGWEDSRGCKIEFEIAKNYGKKIMIIGEEV